MILLCTLSAVGGYWLASRPARPAGGDGPVALVLVRSEAGRAVPLGTPPTAETDRAFRRLQLLLVRGPDVRNSTLNDPRVQSVMTDVPEPFEWLPAHLTAEFDEGGEVLRVGLTGLPRREAVLVLDVLVGRYVDHANMMVRRLLLERVERVERLRTDIHDRIEAERRGLARKAEFNAATSGAERSPAALAALYQERTALRVGAANAAGDAAREKAFATALEANAKAIGDATRVVDRPFATHPTASMKAMEAAEAALETELMRLTIERGADARVSILQAAAFGPTKD